MLEGVARTFALTIAQLPTPVREAVANGYLLCRIADTIEDDSALSRLEKEAFLGRWVDVVGGGADPEPFAGDLGALLSPATSDAERRLVAEATRVVAITRGLRGPQRKALQRGVRIMAHGMVEFQLNATPDGLRDVEQLDRYCYHVAGVVGEMLTELFCDYSPQMERRRADLMPLSASFGKGLQMINVLQDIWGDRRRGACWLPRDVFRSHGIHDLSALTAGQAGNGFARGLNDLAVIARAHLANGMEFVRRIPTREGGIRRSCLWPLGLAVLTLRRICANPGFTHRNQVKVSRKSVRAVVAVTSTLAWSDAALQVLFDRLAHDLPLAETST